MLEVYYESVEDVEAIRAWLENGLRVRRIASRIIAFEKRRDGVLRYPPVQIDVERDPESIRAYLDLVNQPPTVWADVFRPLSEDT